MQYDLLEFDSIPLLVQAVNERIAEGWRPIGGCSSFAYQWENERKGYSETSAWYSQAMTKE